MADKAETTEAGKDAKGGSKKMILIIAIAAIVLIGGGVAAFLMLGSGDETEVDIAQQAKAEKEAQENAVGPMIDIESFIVNILDGEGTRYLKAAITLEVEGDPTAEEVNLRLPQIKDAILLLVSNKSFAEVQDLQGKLQLRAELTTRLNALLKTGQIKKIYFTDFVVQ